MSIKIKAHHHGRKAVVYLRQSTVGQLERNAESTKRQYALKDRALALGWDESQVLVLDGDLGKSGTSTDGRSDFQDLVARVGVGEAGAVLALEVSRFSRSQADWHRLVDICALTDTLIVDHDGVYDPNDFNDRVLLGFKGTWSHTELHGMKVRLQGAKLNKARRGELRCRPPIGYCYNDSDTLEMFSDETVTSLVRLLFRKFSELKSAYRVVQYFGESKIKFPKYSCYRPGAYSIEWGVLTYCRTLDILKNPAYAGVYSYGRTSQRAEIIEGKITRRRVHSRPPADQVAYIKDAHAAFISYSEYEENLRILRANDMKSDPMARHGAAKRGKPLLQGLVICGQCGRRMRINYQGEGGCRPSYVCSGVDGILPVNGACWSVVNTFIDQAITDHLFSVMTHDNIDLSLQILNQLNADVAEEDKEWEVRLKHAQYAADKAFRQYDAVDPSNRLAAQNLEIRWNEKLRELEELKDRFETHKRKKMQNVTENQRMRILQLAKSLRDVWNASSTSYIDRKQILGLLVKQVALSPIDVPDRKTKIAILWHTGASDTIYAKRPRGNVINRTAPEVLTKIRELADTHTDEEIAHELNRLSVNSKPASYTSKAVTSLRETYGIKKLASDPTFSVKGEIYQGRFISITGLAMRLKVDRQVIRYWMDRGVLKSVQHAYQAPWWIEIDKESLMKMRSMMRYAKVSKNDILTLVEECAV